MFGHAHWQIGPADALGGVVEVETHFASLSVVERAEEGMGGANDPLGLVGRRGFQSICIEDGKCCEEADGRQDCVPKQWGGFHAQSMRATEMFGKDYMGFLTSSKSESSAPVRMLILVARRPNTSLRFSRRRAGAEPKAKEFIEPWAVLWIMALLADNKTDTSFHHEEHHGKQHREQREEFFRHPAWGRLEPTQIPGALGDGRGRFQHRAPACSRRRQIRGAQ